MWDSRFNCDDEDDSERTLLATFANVDRLSAIAVVDDGSYVRPTDQVDMAMVKAVAKMTVKKGSSAVQQAAKQRQVSDLRAISQKLPVFFQLKFHGGPLAERSSAAPVSLLPSPGVTSR